MTPSCVRQNTTTTQTKSQGSKCFSPLCALCREAFMYMMSFQFSLLVSSHIFAAWGRNMACRLPTNVEGKCLNVREKASSIDASFYSPSPQISDHCFQNIDVYSTDEILSQDTFHLWYQAASHQCKLHRFVSKKKQSPFCTNKVIQRHK